MNTGSRLRCLAAAAAIGWALLPGPGHGQAVQDFSAEILTYLWDVTAPATAAPDGALRNALEALRQERLIAQRPPSRGDSALADGLGRALALGARTQLFLPELAAVHRAALNGDDSALRSAIAEAFVRAGRRAPDAGALDGYARAVRNVVAAAPDETIRASITRPGYTIGVSVQRAAGKVVADVTVNMPAGQRSRTEFSGDLVTRPSDAGLESGARSDRPPRSIDETESNRLRLQLDGAWRDQDGGLWEISGSGATVTLTNPRPGRTTLTYSGQYDLGHVSAAHVFVDIDDMAGDLPDWVRSELIALRKGFRVSLTAAADARTLYGTWSSQHVTYNEDRRAITKVHDPFDRVLVLTRSARKVAQGGRWPEDGP